MKYLAAAEARHTLLLVDDEANVRSALTRLLRRDGYCILNAGNASEGFVQLAQHPVQVVLSDQRMPGASGTEFLGKVRELYPQTSEPNAGGDIATSRLTIEVGNSLDAAFWALVLEVSEANLLRAVEAVGPDFSSVAQYLQAQPSS